MNMHDGWMEIGVRAERGWGGLNSCKSEYSSMNPNISVYFLFFVLYWCLLGVFTSLRLACLRNSAIFGDESVYISVFGFGFAESVYRSINLATSEYSLVNPNIVICFIVFSKESPFLKTGIFAKIGFRGLFLRPCRSCLCLHKCI